MVKSDDNLDKQSQTRLKDSFVGSELSVLDIRWRVKSKGEMRKKINLSSPPGQIFFFLVSSKPNRQLCNLLRRKKTELHNCSGLLLSSVADSAAAQNIKTEEAVVHGPRC